MVAMPEVSRLRLVIGEDSVLLLAGLTKLLESAGFEVVATAGDGPELIAAVGREQPDLVILDPPRAGLGAETAARLANIGAPEIVYLSCDPSTLARDLAVLTHSERKPSTGIASAQRYEISEMCLFDLFPQTFHIETLVRLRRVS